ncbi:MAG: hypothetical protein NTZ78_04085 [Candidatus Aureabacteria bacterium]|nr:hypothetical protein [Candidatus Auribacterota bacterium]
MWWLFITLAFVAFLMVVTSRMGGTWSRNIDAVLLALWLINLVIIFWMMGWRYGLLGIVISIALEPFVMKYSAGPSAK